jgi:hypothetical protein
MIRPGARTFTAIVVWIAVVCAGCSSDSPTQLRDHSVPFAAYAGRFNGILTGRTPCVGDWTSFVVIIDSAGTGAVVTRDDQRFAISMATENGISRIDVSLPAGPGECQTISLVISNLERNTAGSATTLSGQLIGRCCGTLVASFQFGMVDFTQ